MKKLFVKASVTREPALLLDKKHYEYIAQWLQADPTRYRLFGPFWWFIKRELKRVGYNSETLFMLEGDAHDEQTHAKMQKMYPTQQSMFRAAMHHLNEQHAWGDYSGQTELPDGTTYRLNDPDAGAANHLR